MAILDIFKKNKGKAPAPVKTKKEEAKKVEKVAEKKEEKKPQAQKAIEKKISGRAVGVIRFPHVTEKATLLAEETKYVFKVFESANKEEVKQAIQDLYSVEVIKVNMVSIPGKQRRVGRHVGWKGGYKKAIVTLKEGQKIEILPR